MNQEIFAGKAVVITGGAHGIGRRSVLEGSDGFQAGRSNALQRKQKYRLMNSGFIGWMDHKSKVVVKQALDKAQLLFDSLMQQYFG